MTRPSLKLTRNAPDAAPPALTNDAAIDELTRLLPLWPEVIADRSIAGRRKLVATIERALRAERCRGRGGHWAYDLARHAALYRAFKRECAALALLLANAKPGKAKGPPSGGPSRQAS